MVHQQQDDRAAGASLHFHFQGLARVGTTGSVKEESTSPYQFRPSVCPEAVSGIWYGNGPHPIQVLQYGPKSQLQLDHEHGSQDSGQIQRSLLHAALLPSEATHARTCSLCRTHLHIHVDSSCSPFCFMPIRLGLFGVQQIVNELSLVWAPFFL